MNTKSLLTRVAVPVLSLGMLGGLGATLATSASASTTTFVTHSTQHPDTSNVCGVGVIGSDCVWAHDNMSEQFKIISQTGNTYDVQYTSHGSFTALADPTTGAAASFSGSADGTYEFTVTSSQAPNAANLPAQMPSGSGIAAAVDDLFGSGSSATMVGGHYDFLYHAAQFKADDGYNVAGSTVNGTLYEQVG
jgi:hypothetical protein